METNLKRKAGQQLQLIRLEQNLTQEQMSEKLNLSTSAYCKIEYGETDLTLTRLEQIAKVWGISTLELFSRIDKGINVENLKNSSSIGTTKDSNDFETYDNLRELVKANCRIIDLLCKRIDALEQQR